MGSLACVLVENRELRGLSDSKSLPGSFWLPKHVAASHVQHLEEQLTDDA